MLLGIQKSLSGDISVYIIEAAFLMTVDWEVLFPG
jgi:hypothetical protein